MEKKEFDEELIRRVENAAEKGLKKYLTKINDRLQYSKRSFIF